MNTTPYSSQLTPNPVTVALSQLQEPPLPAHLLPRTHLIARLDAARSTPLTVVIAPAGFGKTTLLAAWAAQISQPFARVTLTPTLNDPARFWTTIAAALQPLDAALAAAAQSLSRAPTLSTDTLIVFSNALVTTADPVFLILDDTQWLTNPTIMQGLATLLDPAPPALHLILAGRTPPDLPLPRLRARQQLTELYGKDLRCTPAETTALLTDIHGLSLDADTLAILIKRIDGWLAGLHLATLLLREQPLTDQALQSLDGRHPIFAEYLIAEILAHYPPDVQHFLLHTAILDELEGSCCDALLERQGSELVLRQLAAVNPFLSLVDASGRRYRLHQLFAEALCTRLQVLDPAAVPVLHRRAAAWYAQLGQLETAIPHALAAGDMDQAIAWIVSLAPSYCARNEVSTLQHWLEVLPPAACQSHPHLHLVQNWLQVTGGQHPLTWMVTSGHDAYAGAKNVPVTDCRHVGEDTHLTTSSTVVSADLQGLALALQSIGDVIRDPSAALDLDTLVTGCQLTAPESPWAGLSQLYQGMALWLAGAVQTADTLLTLVARTPSVMNDPTLNLTAQAFCGLVKADTGQIGQAAVQLSHVLATTNTGGATTWPLRCYVLGCRGRMRYEWNDLAGADMDLHAALALAEVSGNNNEISWSATTLIRLHWAQGDFAAAQATLVDATARLATAEPLLVAFIAAAQAWLDLVAGDGQVARRWARERGLDSEVPIGFLREFELVTVAQVWLAQGQADTALQLLDRMRADAEAGGRWRSVVTIGVQQVLAHIAQGTHDRALAMLRDLLVLAEPEGYIRSFVDAGAPLAALLAQLQFSADRSGEPALAYVDTLLAAFERSGIGIPLLPVPEASVPQVTLKVREREVLELVAQGCSDKAIGDALHISVTTVKWHLQNIYRTLGVQSRTQAVAHAREAGLLS